ncbi:MAG: phosphatase PAP2 family protein [Anaerolineales bacterium]|nr:phosphatase PAP2 family protein [Anaerolineales bacterium]MCS7246940.1 phosphatase PAP2 family protein [Anaerolineales bacterium]MDW8160751.1 phosphatase PAP2 family protein [Anaerolineales bacterium]MDW8447674.1 phosphatase PAP2 family protein [Anaerolineales bacterium]
MTRLKEWDQRLSDSLRIDKSQTRLKRFVALLAHSGDSWFWLLGLGIISVFFPALRPTAFQYATSIFALALLVFAIKLLVKRRRPRGEWGAVYRRTDPHSFPSGHAARAVLLAVLGLGLGPLPWGLSLAIWAPMASLSRVALGLHYVSDVIAGGILGALIGLVVLWWTG